MHTEKKNGQMHEKNVLNLNWMWHDGNEHKGENSSEMNWSKNIFWSA